VSLTGRDFLDGPGLVTWLESEGVRNPESRAFTRWKSGGAASVYAADRFLTKVGLHIHLVPDDLWIATPDTPSYKNAHKAAAKRIEKRGAR